MENSRFLECLESDYERIRAIVPEHLDARVPTCPDWTVDDLTWHLGMVYLHKAKSIRDGGQPKDWPPPFDDSDSALELIDRGYSELLTEFAAHNPEDPAGTWYTTDQPVGFWIRRMAQETVVHRIDAELGVGVPIASIPGDLAIDGIDELLRVLIAFSVTAGTEALANSPGYSYAVKTAGAEWKVTTAPGKFAVEGGPGQEISSTGTPDVTITGTPTDLLRWSGNRQTPDEPSTVVITGNQDALQEFHRSVVVATQ